MTRSNRSPGMGGKLRDSAGSRRLPGRRGARPAARWPAGPGRGHPGPGGRRRAARPGAQAAGQGGSRGRDPGRGPGPDGQGRRADGQVRHRPRSARRAAARDRPPGRPEVDIYNPWARVQAHLLCGLAAALRCQCVILPRPGPGTRIHIFGFDSDMERADVLYTSLLVQMWQGWWPPGPGRSLSVRAWRRSWLLGFVSGRPARVRAAEQHATTEATARTAPAGERTALVLADRRQVIMREYRARLPGDPQVPGDLLGERLRCRVHRGAESRYRLGPGPAARPRVGRSPAPGSPAAPAGRAAQRRRSRARKIASLPCRCGQNCAYRPAGSG